MKHLFRLIPLAIVTIALLKACGGNTQPATDSDKTETPTTTPPATSGDEVQLTKQFIGDVLVRTLPEDDTIDYRLTNFPEEVLDEWLSQIYVRIAEGTLPAYSHPFGVPTKDEAYRLQPDKFEAHLRDTVYGFMPDPDTGDDVQVEIVRSYPYDEATGIEFIEEWSYDPVTLRPQKTVIGMTIMFSVYSLESGLFMGNKKLITVWFDDRELLHFPI